MSWRFSRHYTRQEVREMLPQVKEWLERLRDLRERLERFEKRVGSLQSHGGDVGGETVNGSLRLLVDFQSLLGELAAREIQVKDVERGLVDFPAILQGREVFLCWELGEEDVEFWHEIDAGYAGREPLGET